MGTIAKPPLYRVTLVQLLVACVASGLLATADPVAGYSFLIGCLIQIAGGAYFTRLAYRYQGATQVKSMVQVMYRGQSGKLLLAAAMFAATFILIKPLNALLVFIGYIIMLILHAVLVAVIVKQRTYFGQ
ncbi:MAG: ATP synthase subunit I [Porticoccaceae bacterium]